MLQFLRFNLRHSSRASTDGLFDQKPPETADEYLAAGVELEEAGEKWRAGDAAKASRFFVRAIEMYDEGLGLFPTSFDMAYNKYGLINFSLYLTLQPFLLPVQGITLHKAPLDGVVPCADRLPFYAELAYSTTLLSDRSCSPKPPRLSQYC